MKFVMPAHNLVAGFFSPKTHIPSAGDKITEKNALDETKLRSETR